MKSNSTIYPNKVIESNNKIYIADLNSIQTVITEELENPQTSYTYEMYELPIARRDNLMEYIENNYDILVDFAKEQERLSQIRVVTEEEKQADMVNQLMLAYLAQF